MYRGTTPTLIFNINSSIDLSSIKQVWITFEDADETTFTKDDVAIDVENKRIILELTQEQTLKFTGKINCQMRILDSNDKALCSPILKTSFNRIIKECVIDE